jgi:hypothetical protein
MGFTFKGLTSSALLSRNTASTNAGHKDIADVPASVQGHTSMEVKRPDEKLGSPRESAMSDYSDDDMNKIDTTASSIWKKRDLILAYILYVSRMSTASFTQTNNKQHVVSPILLDLHIQHFQHPLALRH